MCLRSTTRWDHGGYVEDKRSWELRLGPDQQGKGRAQSFALDHLWYYKRKRQEMGKIKKKKKKENTQVKKEHWTWHMSDRSEDMPASTQMQEGTGKGADGQSSSHNGSEDAWLGGNFQGN